MKRLLASTLMLSALMGAPTVWAQAAQNAGDAARGHRLFLSYNCYLCHDTVGQGGPGPTIAPPDLPPRAAFMAFVRHPTPTNMPPFTTKVLSDSDLSAIWDYLHSLPPPPSKLPPELARLRSGAAK